MKPSRLGLGIILSGLAFAGMTSAFAFGPYFNPYDGSATVTTGKKKGSLVSSALASTTDGADATLVISGKGAKGIQVNAQLGLQANGKGTFTLSAKVLADPRAAAKGDKFSRGKKVVVKIKAKGTYTVVDANTIHFTFSGNSGKGGGTNVTGTFATDALGNLSFSAASGFNQKISGVGRRFSLSFSGVSSTTP